MTMMGGDNDTDDHAAEVLWDQDQSGVWTPECWRKSPEQLQAEARMMNNAAFASCAANAGKHSNPPEWNAGRSL